MLDIENDEDIERDNTNVKIKLRFLDITNYFGVGKRPLKAGEELVEAGFVYAIGVAPPPVIGTVIGLIIQTSSLTSAPHEVQLKNIEDTFEHWHCNCTCKAGCGEKCKHVAACLIHIYKFPYLSLISCTELRQKWGKSGGDVANKFNVAAVKKLCCVRLKQKEIEDEPTDAQKSQILSMFLEVSNSELARMKAKNRTINFEILTDTQHDNVYKMLINHDGLLRFIPVMKTCMTAAQESRFLANVVKTPEQILEICKATISQTSALWFVERKLRITGSISYNIHTYTRNRNPDWKQKVNSLYKSGFKGNANTDHGKYSEPLAKIAYRTLFIMMDCGLVISKDIPLLAVSPDGLACVNGEWRLVEIKCPVAWKLQMVGNFIRNLSYIKENAQGDIILNSKHRYYGQVQMGLAVTNLDKCDFEIYGKHGNDFYVIPVLKDEEFIFKYLSHLIEAYFNHIFNEIVF